MREAKPTPVRRIYNLCGRIHLGPCLVNGGPNHRDLMCMACGEVITEVERHQINKTWDTVHEMLARYKVSK